MVIYTFHTQGPRFVESHISRKTSEMWGTRHLLRNRRENAARPPLKHRHSEDDSNVSPCKTQVLHGRLRMVDLHVERLDGIPGVKANQRCR